MAGTDEAFDPSVFLKAQARTYDTILGELKAGRKEGHWIWFVFPQLRGLGKSFYADLYGLQDISEAKEYLDHPQLSRRLRECAAAMIRNSDRSAREILGQPDDLKFHACLTLFDLASPSDIFAGALATFFQGERHRQTLDLIATRSSRSSWIEALVIHCAVVRSLRLAECVRKCRCNRQQFIHLGNASTGLTSSPTA